MEVTTLQSLKDGIFKVAEKKSNIKVSVVDRYKDLHHFSC